MRNNTKEFIGNILHSGQKLNTGCQVPDLEKFKRFKQVTYERNDKTLGQRRFESLTKEKYNKRKMKLSQSKNNVQFSKDEEEEILQEEKENGNNGEKNIST